LVLLLPWSFILWTLTIFCKFWLFLVKVCSFLQCRKSVMSFECFWDQSRNRRPGDNLGCISNGNHWFRPQFTHKWQDREGKVNERMVICLHNWNETVFSRIFSKQIQQTDIFCNVLFQLWLILWKACNDFAVSHFSILNPPPQLHLDEWLQVHLFQLTKISSSKKLRLNNEVHLLSFSVPPNAVTNEETPSYDVECGIFEEQSMLKSLD
jgi:hypothetical protein